MTDFPHDEGERTSPLSTAVQERLRTARSAHLATADALGQPHLVPICFAFDGIHIFTPIDHKPKSTAWTELARVRNIRANPLVAFLIDEYSEQWTDLWYVQIRGVAVLFTESLDSTRRQALQLLREKYTQYRGDLLHEEAPVIRIAPLHVHGWRFTSETP